MVALAGATTLAIMTSGAAAQRPRPTSGQGHHALLDRALRDHAANWLSNRLDAGSLRNVRTVSSRGRPRIRGDYTFNRGAQGWVEAEVAGGRITCLQFWDTPDCETVAERARVVAATEAYRRGDPVYVAVRNLNGATSACLQRAEGGNVMASRRVRNGYGDVVRTDSYATGSTVHIRNICATRQTYTSGSTDYAIGPRATITLRCDYRTGENAFGQMVSGGISACYKVGG